MGRLGIIKTWSLWRSRAITVTRIATRALEVAARHGPDLVFASWTYLYLRRPLLPTATHFAVGDPIPPPVLLSRLSLAIRALLIERVTAANGPILVTLGALYQGWQGLLLGLVGPLETLMLDFTVEWVPTGNVLMRGGRIGHKDDPGVGDVTHREYAYALVWPDALFLAAQIPLILNVLRSQGVERAGLI